MTPLEIRQAQTKALIEDIMTETRPEDLPKIYAGLEHYFAKNCTGAEIEAEIRNRVKH